MLMRLAAAAAITCSLFAPADAREVKVAVPTNPPFVTLESSRLGGVVGESFARIAKDLGWTASLNGPMPFGRVYDDVHSGQADVALSVLATPDRMKLALYSQPIITEYVAVVVAPGKAFKFETTADLAGKTVGTRVGFRYPLLDGASGIKFEPVADDATNMRKLLAGRIDAMLVGSVTGVSQLDRGDFKGKYEILPVAAGRVSVGGAFADEHFKPEDVERFNAALKSLQASAEWTAILDRAGGAALYREYPLVKP